MRTISELNAILINGRLAKELRSNIYHGLTLPSLISNFRNPTSSFTLMNLWPSTFDSMYRKHAEALYNQWKEDITFRSASGTSGIVRDSYSEVAVEIRKPEWKQVIRECLRPKETVVAKSYIEAN